MLKVLWLLSEGESVCVSASKMPLLQSVTLLSLCLPHKIYCLNYCQVSGVWSK